MARGQNGAERGLRELKGAVCDVNSEGEEEELQITDTFWEVLRLVTSKFYHS